MSDQTQSASARVLRHFQPSQGISSSCKPPNLVQIQNTPDEYWKTVEELSSGPRQEGEFPGGLPSGKCDQSATRRDFLALMGFSLAAGLTGCRAPVEKAVPLLTASDEIVPGVANFYATTCGGCASSCSLLVKQRDGRPIKIEGNAESPIFEGGTCATGQATVLDLYDEARVRGPLWRGRPATWEEIDQRVIESLHAARKASRDVVVLSSSINSPSTLQIIADLGKVLPGFRHVSYDPISLSAMREANALSFGHAMIPHYFFDKARVIVGLEADFLGTWLSPVEFARQYARNRSPKGTPALHIQFESGFSVTGSNADVRITLPPSQLGLAATALLRRITEKAGTEAAFRSLDPLDAHKLDMIADALWRHRGESLVVSGVNDPAMQVIVNGLNSLLGNIGKTLDIAHPSLQRKGDDRAMATLVDDMNQGRIHTLVLYGVNPGYDYHDPQRFLSGLKQVALSVSFSDRSDETSSYVDAICPDHHFLESWGDAEPVDSEFSLAQPLISPLFNTRAAQESLLRWGGDEKTSHYDYLRKFWRQHIFPRQNNIAEFDAFWDATLQRGVISLPAKASVKVAAFHGDAAAAAKAIAETRSGAGDLELQLYESVALRDGRHANNPWLLELPDPVSKVTWGNYAAIAPRLAEKQGLSNGDVIRILTPRGQVEAPILIQPGQDPRTLSAPLGFGRSKAGKAGNNVGVNVFPLTSLDSHRRYSQSQIKLEKTGRHESLASTQSDFSMEGRPIVLETSLEELRGSDSNQKEDQLPSLWAKRLHGEHSWGMVVDINACTGCSACVVACQAENNVPVVGKDQIERLRIMHWIRIDHYYRGDPENPVSLHQPMMCQHCQNAPCETVCPVLATTTSSEGLNQQVYNRCIGTRYCANNCPYKVRRFNWYNYTENATFDYNMANPLGRMVLNPDVVVRSRGVMEKCSLCIQRIQLAKNSALQGRRELVDGEIQTACQQACPTQAIVFGDLNDSNSRVSQLRRSQRHYQVLDELGTRPNVGYLKKVRNRVEAT